MKPAPVEAAVPEAPDVVLVVLDNVRADRLALCGHDRPTSDALEAFAADAWHTCRAYAPGPWTLPSHASYFTGARVPEHGAHFSDAAPRIEGQKMQAHALSDRLPTLAERFAKRGYRTVLVSGNPVVSHTTGLVVNVADAHVPWRAVPEGLAWVPPRPVLNTKKDDPTAPTQRLVAGAMTDDEREAYTSHLRDVYDYAVFRADRTLGRVLEVLDGKALLDGRVAITSDHGEFLGEHAMLGHGRRGRWGTVRAGHVVARDTGCRCMHAGYDESSGLVNGTSATRDPADAPGMPGMSGVEAGCSCCGWGGRPHGLWMTDSTRNLRRPSGRGMRRRPRRLPGMCPTRRWRPRSMSSSTTRPSTW